MPDFTDQTGRTVTIPPFPKRIISLVPSQTELLADLGLEDHVIGITKFCVHPEAWFHSKTRIGGTKQLHLDQIRALQPDLIIANKEENVKEQVEDLMRDFPVWVSDVNDLPSAIEMITKIGNITDVSKKATEIAQQVEDGFSGLNISTSPMPVAYIIWKNPYMTVGNATFITDMLSRAGFHNVFAHKTRYPEISLEEIRNSGAQYVFLSSEPYPFRDKHIAEIESALPRLKCLLVDGELFSWYGSRLLQTPDYFKQLREKII